jgi:hypothetical protein
MATRKQPFLEEFLMADLSGFDAGTVEPAVGFAPLPPDDYLAAIVASETKPTKAGTGSYLELVFEILEGAFNGRKLWARLNLDNPNQQAVDIARAELSAICRATGAMTPGDSSELHDKPLSIQVEQRARSDNGELTNEIRKYSSADGVTVPAAANDEAPWG